MGVVITSVELLPDLVVTGDSSKANLIKGTEDFTLDSNRFYGWINKGSWTFSKDSEGFTVASRAQTGQTSNNIPSIYSSLVSASKGDTFTFSCWLMVDDASAWDVQRPYIFEVYNSSGDRVQYTDVLVDASITNKPSVVSGKWVMFRSYHTVTAEDAVNVAMRVSLFRNGSLHVKKCKIEKGSVNSPVWTPENTIKIRVGVKETITEPKGYRLPFTLGQPKGNINKI